MSDETLRGSLYHSLRRPSVSRIGSALCRPGIPIWANRVDFAKSAIGPLTLQQRTCCLAIHPLILGMIQVLKVKHRIMRYELSDCECGVIKPMLPNRPRGISRVDDRRILNGIFWVLRSRAPWRDLPEIYGPHATCYNRFGRRPTSGTESMEALAATHDAAVRMIDTSVVHVHQHGGLHRREQRAAMGRSRGE